MWGNIFLGILGLCAGFAVACGVFAFISMIGIPPRLAGRTHTAKHIHWYENMLMLGAGTANLIVVWELPVPGGRLILIVAGLFFGIFVGCMAVALSEVLKAVPAFLHRISLTKGIPALIASVAFGKLLGGILQFFFIK